MLFLGIALGLVLGLLAGGRLANLAAVRLRWLGVLFAAVVVRFLTEAAIVRGVEPIDAARIPLLGAAYAALLISLWVNRRQPGLSVAFVGILLNAVAILLNGGWMPVWEPSLTAAGFGPTDLDPLHVVLASPLDASFLVHAGLIGDIIPLPLPYLRNVLSVGDIVLSLGLATFLFATVVRRPDEVEDEWTDNVVAVEGLAGLARLGLVAPVPPGARPHVAPETGLAPGLAEAAMLDRPSLLGGSGLGISSLGLPTDSGAIALPLPVAVPGIAARVRRHPYVRLALDGRFSSLWIGQLVSLFGDRVHQVALAFLVLGVTNSPLAVGLVFVAATLPNLLLGPVAGTLVDRWDQKQVLVVSDLLRASVAILLPVAAALNVYLVYPLVFLLTAISIFFRPARAAVLPRIVSDDDLLTANSAMWIGETLADVVGYPLAGLFVAFIGTAALPLAFWIDGASYVVSALLISAIAIPPVAAALGANRGTGEVPGEGEGSAPASDASFRAEFLAGWRFLRGEVVLLVNTIQGVAGQLASGVVMALTPVYAQRVLHHDPVDAVTAYAFLETGIGVGSLAGGILVGMIGERMRRGTLVIGGYVAYGAAIAALALTDSLPIAVGLTVAVGIANMIYIIPSQTLFQERTPPDMIGRVIGFRFSLVFGAMTLAMAAGGAVGGIIGVAPVIAIAGMLSMLGGLAGLLFPAVRRA